VFRNQLHLSKKRLIDDYDDDDNKLKTNFCYLFLLSELDIIKQAKQQICQNMI